MEKGIMKTKRQWRDLVNTVDVGKFLNNYITGGFSRRAQLHGVSQL
jgi:hypothetical protein